MDQYKRLDRKLKIKGSIIDYYHDTIEVNGEKQVVFDFIEHKGAAAMIPVDSDGNIIMVRQYRNAIDRETLEIPAGGLNQREDPMECAIRECEEETGLKPLKATHLIDLYTSVAFCNEKISVYYTNELISSEQNLDEDEFVTIEKYPLEDLCDMIIQGQIQDAKTISAILAYKTKLG